MFFGIPGETPFDLRFWVFGTHVRVHPMHWIVSAVLGWDSFGAPGQLIYLPVWLFAVFFSVLVHEMGHVLMGRLFGCHGHILLYGMGGLAFGTSDLRTRRWQRILISFAGPLAQFVLLGVVIAISIFLLPLVPHGFARQSLFIFYGMLFFINLFWPILNLLPSWPLDGGMITREILDGIAGRKGIIASLWVSILVAGFLAVQSVLNIYNPGHELIPYVSRWFSGGIFMALFFAMFCVSSYQALQQERTRYGRWDDELPWER